MIYSTHPKKDRETAKTIYAAFADASASRPADHKAAEKRLIDAASALGGKNANVIHTSVWMDCGCACGEDCYAWGEYPTLAVEFDRDGVRHTVTMSPFWS